MNTHRVSKIAQRLPDGSIDWESLPSLRLGHFLWETNGYRPEVNVRLGYTPDKLHVCFRAYESDPLIRYHRMNDPVYTDSCVEFFFQPLPESDLRYFNFELNAAGTLLLGLGVNRDRRRVTEIDPALFDIKPAVNVQDPNGGVYWQVQFAIPASFVQEHFPPFRLASGAAFRANFYKCGDETDLPHYGCWNKIESEKADYHQYEYFGALTLA